MATSSTVPKPSPVSLPTQTAQGFAVMELFTSQGCSSCPPADDLLGKYAEENNKNIIPLAFHVDYWNRLGWQDPFSCNAYSERQKYYSRKLGSEVYTPQLIINGEKEMVGSDEEKIKTTIAAALNERPLSTITDESCTISSGQVKTNYSITGTLNNSMLIALLIQHKVITKVKAGENNGATLINYNIVRAYASYPAKQAGSCSLSLPKDGNRSDLSLVLLTQNNGTGKITGAYQKSFR
jgi:hypothetical protein